MHLPALADSTWLRFSAFTVLYLAQGLPYGVFVIALPAWLVEQGHGAAVVGTFIAAAMAPWSLKLLVGPIMDRWSFLPMGRRRPWVLAAQFGITLSWLALATTLEPGVAVLTLFAVLVNTFAAAQDVATDGLAVDVLPVDERARANAFMFGGQFLGIAAGSLGGALLLQTAGVATLALVMTIATAAVSSVPLLLRERSGERLLPWSPGAALQRSLALRPASALGMARDVLQALLLPMSLLLLLGYGLLRTGSGVLSTLFPVAGAEVVGWDATVYPYWATWGSIAAIVVGLAAAPFIDRNDARRAAMLVTALLAIFYASVGLSGAWASHAWLVATVLVFNGIGQAAGIALIALFMGLCAPRLAATQFAVYMAWSNLSLAGGSALAGSVLAGLDPGRQLLLVGGLTAGATVTLHLFDAARHQRGLQGLAPPAAA